MGIQAQRMLYIAIVVRKRKVTNVSKFIRCLRNCKNDKEVKK